MAPEDPTDLDAEVVGLLIPIKRVPRILARREGWEVRELVLFRNAFGERTRHWFQFDPQGTRVQEMRVRD